MRWQKNLLALPALFNSLLLRIERCITALIKNNVQLKETASPPLDVGGKQTQITSCFPNKTVLNHRNAQLKMRGNKRGFA